MAKISVFCIASLGRQVVLGLGDDVCKNTKFNTECSYNVRNGRTASVMLTGIE